MQNTKLGTIKDKWQVSMSVGSPLLGDQYGIYLKISRIAEFEMLLLLLV